MYQRYSVNKKLIICFAVIYNGGGDTSYEKRRLDMLSFPAKVDEACIEMFFHSL